MGFERVFHNLTFENMEVFRKQVQSLVDYVLNHCLDICNVNQILPIIARFKLLGSPIWPALISTRGMTVENFFDLDLRGFLHYR